MGEIARFLKCSRYSMPATEIEKQQKPLLNSGRMVILTKGRHAGTKAVLCNIFKVGETIRCVVAGIQKPPRKITKSMNRAQISERIRIKTYIKVVNIDHVIFTRYIIDALKNDKSITVQSEFMSASAAGKKKHNNAFKLRVCELFKQGKLHNFCSKLIF